MDVYVVSNVWTRDATIIGASVDEPGAKAIADRVNAYGDRWDRWEERYDPPLNRAFLERVALLPDGTAHPSLSQEIVRVPLAGYIGDWPIVGSTVEGLATSVPALARAAIVSDLSGITREKPRPVVETPDITRWVDLGVAPPPTASGMKEAMELVIAARDENVSPLCSTEINISMQTGSRLVCLDLGRAIDAPMGYLLGIPATQRRGPVG
jgi:hypothetical protein